jgi:hypothetical protein
MIDIGKRITPDLTVVPPILLDMKCFENVTLSRKYGQQAVDFF